MNNSMVRTKRSWHTFLRDAGQMLRLAWAARPRLSLVAILFSVIQSLLPVAAAWISVTGRMDWHLCDPERAL